MSCRLLLFSTVFMERKTQVGLQELCNPPPCSAEVPEILLDAARDTLQVQVAAHDKEQIRRREEW